ncbi:hypothetical protein KAR91_53770 [Candidatus Pacearchaeota archaeon]|nr:hypothetical protein [Candidatus Pacearchaeota archaeon]
MKVKLEVKCIGCGEKKTLEAGTPESREQPMCSVCGMPMLPDSATAK